MSRPCSTGSGTAIRMSLAELFSRHRDRLGRMVEFRLDGRLKGRVAASDVLQEAYIDALKRLPHYQADPGMPFFLWPSLDHGPAAGRGPSSASGGPDPGRRPGGADRSAEGPSASSARMIELIGDLTSPSQAVQRAETMSQLQQALDGLDPIDREVLALRHFEELSNQEAAAVLEIQPAAASKRYVRALERLKDALSQLTGFDGEAAMIDSASPDDVDLTPDLPADTFPTHSTGWPRSSSRPCRRGESPSVGEYEGRFPDHAQRIRELLPSVAMMEQLERRIRSTRHRSPSGRRRFRNGWESID